MRLSRIITIDAKLARYSVSSVVVITLDWYLKIQTKKGSHGNWKYRKRKQQKIRIITLEHVCRKKLEAVAKVTNLKSLTRQKDKEQMSSYLIYDYRDIEQQYQEFYPLRSTVTSAAPACIGTSPPTKVRYAQFLIFGCVKLDLFLPGHIFTPVTEICTVLRSLLF